MNYGSTLKTPLSFLFLPFSSSGYEMSGSGVGDTARWESRHLLQELLNTEIQVYIEPEKNCTEPGKTRTGLRRAERCSDHIRWKSLGVRPNSSLVVVMSCLRLFGFGLKTRCNSFQIHTIRVHRGNQTNTPGNFCKSGGIKIMIEISGAVTLLFLFTFTVAHFTRSSE